MLKWLDNRIIEGNKNQWWFLVNTFEPQTLYLLRDLQDQLFMTGKSGEYLTCMILGAGGLIVVV